MYVSTLPAGLVRRSLGDDAPNPTPWIAGAMILLLAVVVPQLTKRIPARAR